MNRVYARSVRQRIGPHLELHVFELGDKSLLLTPTRELKRQLERSKLELQGIQLVDDLDALSPPDARPLRKRRSSLPAP